MTWFFVALIAPFLWSLLNHADKYLLNKYSTHHVGVGALSIYSSIFALFSLPIIFVIDPTVLGANFLEIVSLLITGIMFAGAVLLYMYALETEDASYVVPFWQLIPVFSYILGMIFLNEILEGSKILGAIITILGAVILSLEFEEGKRFKIKPVMYMVGSSLLLAISYVVFKDVTLNSSFWLASFWNQVGMGIFGIFCLIFVHEYRKDFKIVLTKGGKTILGLNIGGEIIQTVASIINNFATLLAPISLVLLVSYTFQPLIVFVEGLLLAAFLPKLIPEKLSKKHAIQKFVSIVIMGIGVYLVL